MKLFDSEWKVMEVLWQENDRTAKELSLRLADSIGWNKNTTYTVIKKCIDKGAIERREPNFVCHAAITKRQAQKEEADSLVDKVFGGSAELLFASILSDRSLSKDELARLRALMEAQPEYIAELRKLPPKLRAAWLEGSWDIFEGQFFEDFRTEPDLMAAHEAGVDADPEELRAQHRWCHVIKPFDIAAGACRGWHILRSYDFGYGKPFSCAWWAMDYDGVLYRILELYGCTETANEGVKWSPDEQFKRIAEIEDTHPWLKGRKITGVADPAIWDASRGESIADTAARYRVYFTPGDNKRVPGWMQCHYRLQFDAQGYARMYVFDTCKAFIRTVPLMMYSRTNPEDLDTTLEDHVSDEWRYLCMSRPVKPMLDAEEEPVLSDPLNQMQKPGRYGAIW